jgi:membrane protease YdiL (CAAX protease family)
MDTAIEQAPGNACLHCNNVVGLDDKFCGSCGHEILPSLKTAHVHEDVFTTLWPTLLYYGITLLLLALYKLSDLFGNGFEDLLAITIIDVTIVIVFWGLYFRELKPLFYISRIKIKHASLTVAGAIGGAIVVSVVADLINISISDDVFYSTSIFYETSHPLVFATLLIAVQPAIFEEVAFRGFMFNNLSQITSAKSTIYITAFVFGIIHLALISMLWLVPIGIIFAWLRSKYNTLWYGMIGHFTYNFCITIMEFYGWSLVR